MILLLFTAVYPSVVGAESNFLDVEIRHLAKAFNRVILVPRNIRGTRVPLPEGVEVDESYASFLNNVPRLTLAWLVMQSPYFYREILRHPAILLHPSEVIRLAAFIAGSQLTSRWVKRWIDGNGRPASELIFYTYWFDQAAMGVGLLKNDFFPDLRLVSRAHGYDLYEEYYYKLAYWPCRDVSLSSLDFLYPDSQAGTEYLRVRYPEYSSKFRTSFLGVSDPGFLNQPSQDGVFRIASCSMIRPEKRVERLLEGIRHAAELRPAQRFEWYHIGNGESRDQLQGLANKSFPPNARAYLPGYSNKQTLIEFYRTTRLDAFVNVSATEGTSVSIMEAISCGLPVIATRVGGNPEIVSQENGILLSPNADPQEIATALFELIDKPTETKKRRKMSRKLWSRTYDADRNFSDFVQSLRSLHEAKRNPSMNGNAPLIDGGTGMS